MYDQFDGVVGPFLEGLGFARVKPAEYLRRVQGGQDRVSASKGPPSKARTHFAVFMSYYPDYLEPIFELVDYEGEDRGFPCGPYLNPVGAGQRPKYWSYVNRDVLSRSLEHVLHCLRTAGIGWLESLHDPHVFAASVDSMAPLPAAMAHEVIGDYGAARRFYSEMMRRFHSILERSGESKTFLKYAKAFVFTAIKLDIEHERRERLQQSLGFHPQIKPLPPV